MKQWNKQELSTMLAKGICQITFTKVNGEQRVMPCTLKEEFLPNKTTPTTASLNETNMAVWCVDKQAWRSFKVANVTDVLWLA